MVKGEHVAWSLQPATVDSRMLMQSVSDSLFEKSARERGSEGARRGKSERVSPLGAPWWTGGSGQSTVEEHEIGAKANAREFGMRVPSEQVKVKVKVKVEIRILTQVEPGGALGPGDLVDAVPPQLGDARLLEQLVHRLPEPACPLDRRVPAEVRLFSLVL